MTSINYFKSAVSFFLYVLVQVFILKDLVVFGTAFCFLYIFFILLLPIEIKTIPLLLIGFFMGFCVDIFYDSLGMHTASTVLMAFIRRPWLNANVPTGGYDENVQPSILNMGFIWFTAYSLPLIIIHHFCFFYIDNLGTDLYIPLVIRTGSSVFFTLMTGIIVQLIFYNKKRGI